jgi:hypothetical protein|tara:strand:- start:3057 stop:3497 length:441 start_codon:yes stop_codon:yes gene_type:complete
MRKVFVIKSEDDGNIAVATNKKEVVNIIKKYVQKLNSDKKLMALSEGENGWLVKNPVKWFDLKFVSIDDKAYWDKVYTNICKQLRECRSAFFEPLYIKGEKQKFACPWDSLNFEIQEFETNTLNSSMDEVESHGMAHEIEFIDDKN